MSSEGSSARAGQQTTDRVTKHHVCCTNGPGEPRILVSDVEPGSIVRYGTDDDMTCLVVGNFRSEIYVGDGKGGIVTKEVPTLLLYGCFCDEETDILGRPTGGRPYEEGRLMTATFGELDTVSIVMEPGMY